MNRAKITTLEAGINSGALHTNSKIFPLLSSPFRTHAHEMERGENGAAKRLTMLSTTPQADPRGVSVEERKNQMADQYTMKKQAIKKKPVNKVLDEHKVERNKHNELKVISEFKENTNKKLVRLIKMIPNMNKSLTRS